MTFQKKEIETFLALFRTVQDKIRQVEGCRRLELWQDNEQPECFTTFSLWDSVNHLNAYRDSDLFKATWAKTKPLFSERAQAHSYLQVDTSNGSE